MTPLERPFLDPSTERCATRALGSATFPGEQRLAANECLRRSYLPAADVMQLERDPRADA
jgi:hypothetical protein